MMAMTRKIEQFTEVKVRCLSIEYPVPSGVSSA